MKFLLISNCAEGAGLLYRLQQEGNEVNLYIKDDLYTNAWDGILPKVKKWESGVTDDTIVLFDTIGFGKIADSLKKRGIKVFGASSFADKLETDRQFGSDFMKAWGIKTPETKSFTLVEDGIKFIKSSNWERCVFKPHGSHNKIATSMTYCSKDMDDMLYYLEFIKKHVPDIDKFDLQKFMKGVTISSEVFVSNGTPLNFYDNTIENKKFLNKDLGPSTGCEGNVVFVTDSSNPLISQGIGKVKSFEDYTGFADLNCIICESGVYALEWTVRNGYDATPTLLCGLLYNDVGELITNIIDGEINEKDFSSDYATSIRLTIPPYPLEGRSPDYDNTGIPIRAELDDFYFSEVMLDNGDLVHSGGIGLILLSIATNEDIKEGFIESLEKLNELVIPDKQYRTDLGEIISKDFIKFNDWSYSYAN